MPPRLPKHARDLFIEDVLIPSWDPAGAVGFDPDGTGPGDEAFLPIASSLEEVSETYPHITVQRSTESSGGETTYDFMTNNGPGQQRNGQLVVVARAEDIQEDYTGASGTHDAVDAEDLVGTLIDEVEDVCLQNANGGDTAFSYLGSQPGADAPNDYDATPTVFIDQCTVSYGWDRTPE